MKTPILLATAVLSLATLPALSAETHDNESAEKIKALEAEIEALRAQLRAEGRIRGEDMDRGRDRVQGRRPGPDQDRRPDGPPPRDMHDDQHRHGDERHHEEEHRVMHFDLGEMTGGEMEGEIHIEIMGDMDDVPHAVREMVMEQMRRGGHGMPEMFMHMDEHDRHMDDHERHEMFMRMDEEEMRRRGDHFGHSEMGRPHMEPHHMDHGEEDPFFQEGGEFVGKMQMSGMIADALSDPINVALFGVWEARQHLEPPQRLEILLPILQDDAIALPVRNAAAMVARESFVELGDFEQARAVLALQIRINGSMN